MTQHEVHKITEGILNIEGIDLVLSGVSFLGLDVNITTTTDENGIAVFEGVPVGTYTITEEESTVPYGYLTADPIEGVEVVYAQQNDVDIYNAEMTGSTPSRVAVMSFNVTIDRSRRKDDEQQADFITCVALREKAMFIQKYFGKGRLIIISGELRSRIYEDKNATKHYVTEVYVDNVFFG